MKRMKKRKGFTIVELVIVIAVIAILATTLMPTFGNVIQNAKDSAAKQEAKNAFTSYMIEHPELSGSLFIYQTDGRYVAIKNGAPIGIYDTQAEACKSLGLAEDALFSDTGNGNLWISGDAPITPSNPTNPTEPPVEPAEPTDWSGAKAVFIGDSITYGVGTTSGKCYYDYLKSMLGLGQVINEGVSGACFSVASDYGDGHVTGKGYRPPLTYRVTGQAGDKNLTTDSSVDLVVVFLGTNDYGHDTPLGSIDDTTDISFYGAMNVAIPKLRELYPNSQLVFMTPLHRNTDTVYNSSVTPGVSFTKDTDPNGRGLVLKNYVDAIEAVCQKNSIPVIDLFDLCQLEPKDKTYFTDGLHPTAKGNEEMAKIIAEKLPEIPRKDKENTGDEGNTDTETPTNLVCLGSKYASGQENNAKRISSACSLYLRKGTVINPTDSTKYAVAVYKTNEDATQQGTSLDVWNSPYTIQNDGYYGLVFKKVNEDTFNLEGSDSTDLYDYVTITFPLDYGSKYVENPNSNKNRACSTTYLELQAGDIITAANGYGVAIYKRDNYTSLTGGFKSSYTVTENGTYGIVIKKDSNGNFDFENGDSKNLYDYIAIEESA